jgi:hypothetical protein
MKFISTQIKVVVKKTFRFSTLPAAKHLDLALKSLYLSQNIIQFASLTVGVLEKWSNGVME